MAGGFFLPSSPPWLWGACAFPGLQPQDSNLCAHCHDVVSPLHLCVLSSH